MAMLEWTITFVLVALLAAALGVGGVVGVAALFARVLFLVFVTLFVALLIRRSP